MKNNVSMWVTIFSVFFTTYVGLPQVQAQMRAHTTPQSQASLSTEIIENGLVNTDTQVLMIRHALAPGGGDPANFNVNDCSTQRNLSQEGINQARTLGQQLEKLGFKPNDIFTSQWCRAVDTAKALDLGPVILLPVLNSYFQNRSAAQQKIVDLRQFIVNLPPKGGRYVMVTHHVVIGDLTGQWVGSGDGVWLTLTGKKDDPWRVEAVSSANPDLPK
jgi:phosphohistidine phosphatase SixA